MYITWYSRVSALHDRIVRNHEIVSNSRTTDDVYIRVEFPSGKEGEKEEIKNLTPEFHGANTKVSYPLSTMRPRKCPVGNGGKALRLDGKGGAAGRTKWHPTRRHCSKDFKSQPLSLIDDSTVIVDPRSPSMKYEHENVKWKYENVKTSIHTCLHLNLEFLSILHRQGFVMKASASGRIWLSRCSDVMLPSRLRINKTLECFEICNSGIWSLSGVWSPESRSKVWRWWADRSSAILRNSKRQGMASVFTSESRTHRSWHVDLNVWEASLDLGKMKIDRWSWIWLLSIDYRLSIIKSSSSCKSPVERSFCGSCMAPRKWPAVGGVVEYAAVPRTKNYHN